MLNATGALAILDRAITLNWDDGATLHRITAQVRYHTPDSASTQILRVSAGKRLGDDPLTLISADTVMQATWVWQPLDVMGAPAWQASLEARNISDADVFLDSLEVLRIDAAFGGLFNVGALPGLWRSARENASQLDWENWGDGANSANGFARASRLLVQPAASNRSAPPAVLIAAPAQALSANAEDTEQALVAPEPRTEIIVEATGEKFERLVARARTDGALLGAGATIASPVFLIVSGDDAAELWAL